MTKPQRLALVATPLLSVGLLSWLPLLYLHLRDPRSRTRTRLIMTFTLLATTGLLVFGLLSTEPGSGMSRVYGLLYLCLLALSTMLTWLESKPVVAAPPAKDASY